MNLNENIPVVIHEDDFELLRSFINRSGTAAKEMSLSAELCRAVVVKKDAFPPNTIRMNSKVTILDQQNGTEREICIVMPQHAAIKENKVSILSPIGTALIGFRSGETVQWVVPAGLKQIKITAVKNENDLNEKNYGYASRK